MIIALDYDDTYTRDPSSWQKMIETFQAAGHSVYGVTFRYGTGPEYNSVDQSFFDACDDVFFTGRAPKRGFMLERDIHVHVWIDDAPDLIVGGITPHKIVHACEESLVVQHTGSVNEGLNWDTLYHHKNAHWGDESEVIELYPAKSRMVNNAPMRHLWRVPKGYRLPDMDGGWDGGITV